MVLCKFTCFHHTWQISCFEWKASSLHADLDILQIDPSARPHGIGIRFHLDGIPLGHSHTDIIAHSTRYFPTRTGAEFLELLRALAAPPPKDGEPSAPEKFLGTHPAAARFVGEDRKAPAGFATDTYWSVNAFKLVNEEGKERHVRYEVHPVTASHLSAEALKGKSPHYLFDELPQQLPADLSLVAQLAAEGDVVDDATSLWPEEREKMELGRFKVEKLVEDGDKAQKKIIFDPLPRVEGVEASADPLLEMRASVYLQSGKERR